MNQPKKVDLKTLSVNELKALAYDQMAEAEVCQNKIEDIKKILQVISTEIASRKEQEVVNEEVVVEKKK